MTISPNVTHHAQVRLSQRGISNRHIELVLNYGTCIYKQGLLFYYIQRGDMIKKILPKEHNAIRNLIVVESAGEQGVVVTAYKNEAAVRKIRKKTKYKLTGRENKSVIFS